MKQFSLNQTLNSKTFRNTQKYSCLPTSRIFLCKGLHSTPDLQFTGISMIFLLVSPYPVLSVRFQVGVFLLLAPAGADKRGPKAPIPLVENAGIQPAICKRVPTRASTGAGSY